MRPVEPIKKRSNPFRPPRLTLFILFWHFAQIFLSGFNWRYFVSAEAAMLGDNLTRAHIVFNAFGMIAYVLGGSVLIFWPYRYGAYMVWRTRRNYIAAGSIVVYFCHVLPCWMMEFTIVWSYGWFTYIQGISFLFLTVSWCVETVAVWMTYMWYASRFMEKNYGNTPFGRGENLGRFFEMKR